MTQHQKTCEYPGCSEHYLTSSPGKAKYCPDHKYQVKIENDLQRQRERREKMKGAK